MVQACYIGLMLTQSDIEERLPVWHAFSQLFLDTELQPEHYSRIASTLRASNIERAGLKTILVEEVAPVFYFNLVAVAGEWSGWTTEQVRDIMTASLSARARQTPLSWIKRRILRRYLDNQWSKLEPLIDAA